MPLEGIFIEPSSNPIPDLSLNISPPNSSSSSTEVDTSFDLLSRHQFHKSTATTSFRTETSQDYTELSLAHPANALDHGRRNFADGADQEPPRNPYHHHHQSHYIHHHHPPPQLNHINQGVSLLDVSEGLRPIRGIPVYQNRTFPFLPLDHHTRDRDPQMSFHQMTYSPWSSHLSPSSSSSSSSSFSLSSSSQSSPYFGASLDPMSILNSGHNPSSSPYRIAGAARFNGISPSYQLHHHHHNQYGVGPSHEASHAMMRSRFMPKLPTKRSMRAPRMRWTSSLHARFVHAVELLGGHESED